MNSNFKNIFIKLLTWLAISNALSFQSYANRFVVYSNESSVEQKIRNLKKRKQVLSYRNLLSQTEALYLKSQGAQMNPIEVTTDLDRASLRKLLLSGEASSTDHYGLKIEDMSYGELQNFPDPIKKEMWGIQNTGLVEELELNEVQSRFIKGKLGQDIGLLGAPAEVAGKKIKVAIVDTGVDYNHPALRNSVRANAAECANWNAYQKCLLETPLNEAACFQKYGTIDADGNGYPMDCHGWNVRGSIDSRIKIAGNAQPADDIGHGTHVAGIALSVASEIEIIPVKVLGKVDPGVSLDNSSVEFTGASSASDLPDPTLPEWGRARVEADVFARGVLYALRAGAQVINLSLGFPFRTDSELMRRVIQLAIQKGVLVIAAAGNQSTEATLYPCRYTGVICVASHSADGSLSHFTNYGETVELAAPGHRILSAWPLEFFPSFFTDRKGYEFKSGTSMASPYVAAVAARLLNQGIESQTILGRLMSSARKTLQPSELVEDSAKSIVSGAIDFRSAFFTPERPWFVVQSKDSLFLTADRLRMPNVEVFVGRLILKNVWKDAESVLLKVSSSSPDLEIVTQPVSILQWPTQTALAFDIQIKRKVGFDKLQARYPLNVNVSYSSKSATGLEVDKVNLEQIIQKTAEFVVPIRAENTSEQVKAMGGQRIDTQDFSRDTLGAIYQIKAIKCSGLESDPANTVFSVIQNKDGKAIVSLIEPFESKLKLSPLAQGENGFVPLNVLCSKKSRAVVFYNLQSKTVQVQITGEVKGTWSWSADSVVPPREFAWISVENGTKRTRISTLSWIGSGALPEVDRPKASAWSRERSQPEDLPSARKLFYLGFDLEDKPTLRAVRAPGGGLKFVHLFSDLELNAKMLLSQGEGYQQKYQLADLTIASEFKTNFNLVRLQVLQSKPFVQWSTVVQPIEVIGSEKNSYVYHWPHQAAKAWNSAVLNLNKLDGFDSQFFTFKSPRPWDLIQEPLGIFELPENQMVQFLRSRFEVFATFSDGEVVSANQRAYETRGHYKAAQLGIYPSLVMAESESSGISTEVLQLDTVARTWTSLASAKTLAAAGCEYIDSDPPLKNVYYFCGSHFLLLHGARF